MRGVARGGLVCRLAAHASPDGRPPSEFAGTDEPRRIRDDTLGLLVHVTADLVDLTSQPCRLPPAGLDEARRHTPGSGRRDGVAAPTLPPRAPPARRAPHRGS